MKSMMKKIIRKTVCFLLIVSFISGIVRGICIYLDSEK